MEVLISVMTNKTYPTWKCHNKLIDIEHFGRSYKESYKRATELKSKLNLDDKEEIVETIIDYINDENYEYANKY